MAVGGCSWRAEAESPNPLQIAAPPISGLLQVSASFLRRCAWLTWAAWAAADITRPAWPACTLGLQATAVRYLVYC